MSNWNIIVIKIILKSLKKILWKALGCTYVMKCFFLHFVMVSSTHFHLFFTVYSVLLWQVSFILTFKFLIAKSVCFMGRKLFEASYAMPCTNVVKSRKDYVSPLCLFLNRRQRGHWALLTNFLVNKRCLFFKK